jgi:cellulose biosynthesis protein BcsQ
MKIITFASWKGGTGKTSLSTACIETLAARGKKILIIDFDSNLSISSIYNALGRNYTSVDFLNGNVTNIPDLVKSKTHMIPSDLKISRLNNISDRVLKVNLSKLVAPFDYIFLDPPGTMCALTRNCLVAADKIIIPAMFSDIDYQATKLILDEMEMCGVDADIRIVLNRHDEKRTPEGIESLFRNDEKLNWFLWSGKIPAMRSISRLTSELMNGYALQGRAKTIIDNFVDEVIL